MRGRLWLHYFTCTVASKRQKRQNHPHPKGEWRDSDWTTFMRGVMDGIGEKMNCHVVQRRQENKELSGEYLNIDAVFIDKTEYDLIKEEWKGKWDPFVLPRAIVELENSDDPRKISYCLWKILCVRAPIRVLICYSSKKVEVENLKQHLEDVIWQGSLMKGTDGVVDQRFGQ